MYQIEGRFDRDAATGEDFFAVKLNPVRSRAPARSGGGKNSVARAIMNEVADG